MYLTPIIYPTSMIPERFQWVLALNPLTGLIETFRYALAPSKIVEWNLLSISLVITVVVFVGGVTYFKRTEKAFADII
jgi:lipopolysaccharide transport system permease protein